MNWELHGRLYNPDDYLEIWPRGYASLPVCDLVENKLLRVYYSVRDEKGRSLITYFEADPENPAKILYFHNAPIIKLGDLGTFDDNGIMPSSIINYDGKKYIYYIGWNPQQTVSYRLSIGLAISKDGVHFNKYSIGPICDRTENEPYFNTAPYVIIEDRIWKMWYVSCTAWKIINNWPEPFYNIKYAESDDGILWRKKNIVCIDYDDFTHAIGKPYVFKEGGKYRMIYSYRNSVDYRIKPENSYRLGYAESIDGFVWVKKNNEVGIHKSITGWDDIMIEYCSGYFFNEKQYLLYNGNGFGKTGIGYATRNLF